MKTTAKLLAFCLLLGTLSFAQGEKKGDDMGMKKDDSMSMKKSDSGMKKSKKAKKSKKKAKKMEGDSMDKGADKK